MLKEYKEKSKLSYDKIQEKTNIDRQVIYRTINDKSIPQIDTYGKICIALNMTAEEIGNEIIKYIVKKGSNQPILETFIKKTYILLFLTKKRSKAPFYCYIMSYYVNLMVEKKKFISYLYSILCYTLFDGSEL